MTYPASVGPLVLTQVGSASAGNTVYTGTITGGGTNNFVGLQAVVSGFVLNNGVNNSDSNGYLVVANGTTTITLRNPNGVAETAPGSVSLLSANVYGPFAASGATSGQATPFPAPGLPPAAPGAPKDTSGVPNNFVNSWNYTNTKLAVQADPDLIEGPQQGTPYITNATAVNLAGYPVGALQYYKGI